jgi:hypothetical protein
MKSMFQLDERLLICYFSLSPSLSVTFSMKQNRLANSVLRLRIKKQQKKRETTITYFERYRIEDNDVLFYTLKYHLSSFFCLHLNIFDLYMRPRETVKKKEAKNVLMMHR